MADQVGRISAEEGKVVGRFFEQYRLDVGRDLNDIDARLDQLRAKPSVEAFALSTAMLGRVLDLRTAVVEVAQMKHVDEAILAAVIVRGEELRAQGETEMVFCTLDADLLPWDKDDRPRGALAKLYSDAGFVTDAGEVAVRNDFRVP